MSFQQIPVRSDLPAYDFKITLDAVVYQLSFTWSERAQLWTMDIADENEEPIAMGIRMFASVPSTYIYKDPRFPARQFLVLDTAGKNKNPGRDDFGSRVLLLYGDDT